MVPTLRGVGITKATEVIQIDRYSLKSTDGIAINFIDTSNKFAGWKTEFNQPNAWIQYNTIDFGKKNVKTVIVKVISTTDGTLQLHLDNMNSSVIAENYCNKKQ